MPHHRRLLAYERNSFFKCKQNTIHDPQGPEEYNYTMMKILKKAQLSKNATSINAIKSVQVRPSTDVMVLVVVAAASSSSSSSCSRSSSSCSSSSSSCSSSSSSCCCCCTACSVKYNMLPFMNCT